MLIRTGTSEAPAVALAVMTRGDRDAVRGSRPITQWSALRMRFEQVENAQHVRTREDLHGLVAEAQSVEEALESAAYEAAEGEDRGHPEADEEPFFSLPPGTTGRWRTGTR